MKKVKKKPKKKREKNQKKKRLKEKSTHFIISNETTTFIIHFTNFFHLSHSHAAITLNHVTTVMIIAKKKANALTADKTTKNTLHIRESVNHPRP